MWSIDLKLYFLQYYIEPVTGQKFRSKIEVKRYLETGSMKKPNSEANTTVRQRFFQSIHSILYAVEATYAQNNCRFKSYTVNCLTICSLSKRRAQERSRRRKLQEASI